MTVFQTRTTRISLQSSNGTALQIHAETAGPPDGPLLVLLHGFPEFWYGWRSQIGPLARAGYHVVVPDQRGYNLSSKPRGVRSYRLDALAGDVLGILDHFGQRQAFIAGHDWGAAVAWHLAIHHAERVERLAILNVPHPGAMARALRARGTGQWLRSWYVLFFQLPRLPEWMLRLGRYRGLRRLLRASARPGTFSAEDLRRYQEAWRQRGALTAMLNWYRAALRTGGGFTSAGRVPMPALILWGERDIALAPELAHWSLEFCDQGRLVLFPDATHWLQHEEPERVTARLLSFFDEARS